ncbi:hypothetical protein BJV82DRAFT_672591 [Fennellomyces sp. T-0311]|nr:hypothetical protein BJV82DRAFT_672591 [Fennellomyces sp. T-0311]
MPDKFYFRWLTYLKLDYTSTGNTDTAIDDVQRIPAQVIGGSPNLKHLFLSTDCAINHGDCISIVLQYCPQLKTLVVSPKAELPELISKQINEGPSLSDKFWTDKGLDTFVLDGAVAGIENNHIISIFNKKFGSLKRLYLTLNPRVGVTALAELASHGAPYLREIYLMSQKKYPTFASLHGGPPIIPTLAALFSKCPSLEVIEIADYIKFLDHSSELSTDSDGNRKTWRDMLLTIAKCCPRLRHLKFEGEFHYSASTMLDFVSTGGSKLAYLEVNTSHRVALDLVTKLTSLKYLYLYQQEDASGKCLQMSQSQRESIHSILQQRGGYFTVK